MSGPYYGDFKTPSAIAPASDAAASPGAAAGAAAAGPPLTAAQVQSKVEAAVAAVMGDVPAPSQPLVEAGLDSLGALCHMCLWSHQKFNRIRIRQHRSLWQFCI